MWRANQWVHARRQIPRRPDGYALHHIAERQLKFRTVKDFLFKDQQRRRPVFLAAIPEGRVNDVLDRLVPVRQRDDDGSVLATDLGQQVHLEFALQHLQRRFRTAREDDDIDVPTRDEPVP